MTHDGGPSWLRSLRKVGSQQVPLSEEPPRKALTESLPEMSYAAPLISRCRFECTDTVRVQVCVRHCPS